MKNSTDGKQTIIYDASESISGLKTPVVQHPKVYTYLLHMPTDQYSDIFFKLVALQEVSDKESARVWGEVSQGIKSNEWERAKEAKRSIEEHERELAKERKQKEETWSPKHFTVTYSKENGWECSPKQKWVPSAPIVFPTQ